MEHFTSGNANKEPFDSHKRAASSAKSSVSEEIITPHTQAASNGNSPDQLILQQQITATGDDASGNEAPEDESTESQLPTLDSISGLIAKPDAKKAKEIYRSTVTGLLRPIVKSPDGENYPWRSTADSLLRFLQVEPYTDIGRKYSRLIAGQLHLWMAIPIAYLIVINWWYVWNYSNYDYDFRQYAEYFPWFKWVFEPFFHSIQYVHYLFIGMRLDSKIPESRRLWFRAFWDYRPITFACFLALIVGVFAFIPGFMGISDFFASVLLGESTLFAVLMPMFSIYAFMSITRSPARLLEYAMSFFPISLIVMLMFLIISTLISGWLGPAFLGLYLMCISYFALFYFSFPESIFLIHKWPFKIYDEFMRIYYDLSEAPVSDPDTDSISKKIGNLLFQEFHNLFVFFFICLSLIIKHLVETFLLVKNPLIILFVFVLNFGCMTIVSGGLGITFRKLLILVDDIRKSLMTPERNELPKTGLDL